MYDPRVDAYIQKAQPFAQPILNHLRELIHRAIPEVTETIKWNFPNFDFKGPLCSFAAFKGHVAFGFWKHSLLKDPQGIIQSHAAQGGGGMGNLGRITSLKDLPDDKTLVSLLKQARELNAQGIKLPPKPKDPSAALLEIPAELQTELDSNPQALANFHAFPPSHRKEYILWISEAKQAATRERRAAQAVEWIAEGKGRNWKYER